MSCMLRAGGRDFSVGLFMGQAGFKIHSFWERGSARFSAGDNPKAHASSGIRVMVSEADFDDFSQQVSDAIIFLSGQMPQVQQLAAVPGLEFLTLDFGVDASDRDWMSFVFPLELLRLAGQAGASVCLSLYPSH